MMAGEFSVSVKDDIALLKSTRISVFVDEALPDILVVTFEFGFRIFKGVLLDSSKRNLPCGVQDFHPAFKSPKASTNPDDDPLYAVSQRFAYTDPSNNKKRNVGISSKYKNNKMTVRLRPRQVLCSKCKDICNENSENVSRKRNKNADRGKTVSVSPTKRDPNARITRSVYTELLTTKKKTKPQKASLVPKLTRLTAEEESLAMTSTIRRCSAEPESDQEEERNVNDNDSDHTAIKEKVVSSMENDIDMSVEHSITNNSRDDSQSRKVGSSSKRSGRKSMKRLLRKKRSIGSMEDLWDETVFEERLNRNRNQDEEPLQFRSNNNLLTTTRTIKISYGQQGEGTVLTIPAQIADFRSISDDLERT